MKARLKTIGVVEHTFSIPDPPRANVDWKVYDVGGARNQRNAWAPYFEDGKLWNDIIPVACPHVRFGSKRDHIFGANFCIRSGPPRGDEDISGCIPH